MTNLTSFFDSHCHLDFAAFDHDREMIWQRCNILGVTQLVIPGVAPTQWASGARISTQLQGIYFSVGIHPWWINDIHTGTWDPQQTNKIRDDLWVYLQQEKCVAIGECGLDTTIETALDIQLQVLDLHLTLASELKIPLIIHCRNAHNELISQLKKMSLPAGGVIHAFSGSTELANTYWRMGFYLGIGGTITYNRANKTRAAAKQLPLESLLLETDAPDMPLFGQQGQRNDSQNIPVIAQTLATIRGNSIDDIARQTTKNAQTLFGLGQ